ncbi:hypothetical protein BSL78_27708 [Apostichopus japonicus]|uniref:Anoctamin dimerisation domain-containing protein n=1 Tax=Stichopus japonicus TaxID=307972 RepID=A0A2G8JIB7_STIJA|nr:hypothetical protein BSL78_27708 [Apostichopus japonicus]
MLFFSHFLVVMDNFEVPVSITNYVNKNKLCSIKFSYVCCLDIQGQEKTAAPSDIELSDAPSNIEKQPLHAGSPAKRTEKEAAEQDQFFKDGVRKIDYVLAFRKDTKEGEDEEKRAKRRKEYFGNLKEEGLHMEEVK